MSAPDPPQEAPDHALDHSVGEATDHGGHRSSPRFGPRVIAIGACIALIGALVAALVATVVLTDDNGATSATDDIGSTELELTRTETPKADDLLSVPLLTVAGGDTSLRAMHDGRPMLVNLWAQSCAPCIKEMPWLESIGAANPDVALIGVNVLDRPDKAEEMAELTGITYPWVRDPSGEMSVAARSASLPDTYLFDSDGTLLASKLGAFASEDAIQTWLDVHLD